MIPRAHLTYRSSAIILFSIALWLTGSSDEGTIATPTSATTTIAAASISETYADTLIVGASGFYSFSVNEYGTVNVTLESIGGTFVPSTVMVGIGIGTPSGTECVTTATLNTASPSTAVGLGVGIPAGTGCAVANSVVTTPALTSQFQASVDSGIHCVAIFDTGALTEPVSFAIRFSHF